MLDRTARSLGSANSSFAGQKYEEPAAAVEQLLQDKSYLQRMGITRIGDLTGLDCLDIPVWFASRPNSRGLSVAQGKGLSHRQAQISATMEALESAYAERCEDLVAFEGRPSTVEAFGAKPIEFGKMGGQFNLDEIEERSWKWVRGVSMSNGAAVSAPYEMIGTDFRTKGNWAHDIFTMSSIGLACGHTLEAAICHGICELIENDGSAFGDAFPPAQALNPSIPVEWLSDELLLSLVSKICARGFQVEFFDLSHMKILPVVRARLVPTEKAVNTAYYRPTSGYACRPRFEEAALAALLEAVQTRATDISGARDDIEPAIFDATMIVEARAAAPRSNRGLDRSLELDADNSGSKLELLKDRLLSCGIPDIYVFPLDTIGDGPNPVRVLLPTVDSAFDQGNQRISSRAFVKLLERGAVQ